MKCDHPDDADYGISVHGVWAHGRTQNIPAAFWCDELREQCNRYGRTYKRTRSKIPGTYEYNACHGIGKAGENRRDANYRYRGTAKGMLTDVRARAKVRGER
jgi:hypothetical protein